jgi:hypothetical protein
LLLNLQDEDGEELQISQGVNMVGAMKRITLLGQREMGTKGGVDVNMTIMSNFAFALLANGRIPFGALYLVRPWP